MSTIHVDPEALRNLSRLLDHQVHQMLEEEYQLKIAAARLEMVWTGGSAQDFMEELQYFQKKPAWVDPGAVPAGDQAGAAQSTLGRKRLAMAGVVPRPVSALSADER